MRKSPIFPKYEGGDYGVHDFDPEIDFAQLLNEVKRDKIEKNIVASSPYNVELEGRRRSDDEKKGKKSWKRSLFSWLKPGKKNKAKVESEIIGFSHKPKLRKGHTSGPVYGSSIGESEVPSRRPTSGPLSGLFGMAKRSEKETPYMTLGQLGKPNSNTSGGASPYGPVYLVT